LFTFFGLNYAKTSYLGFVEEMIRCKFVVDETVAVLLVKVNSTLQVYLREKTRAKSRARDTKRAFVDKGERVKMNTVVIVPLLLWFFVYIQKPNSYAPQ
jgi:hypothetical protein